MVCITRHGFYTPHAAPVDSSETRWPNATDCYHRPTPDKQTSLVNNDKLAPSSMKNIISQ